MPTAEKAMERLSGRMDTLDDLYGRGIVTGNLLRKQIKSLLSSKDARTIYREQIETDKQAIKILCRLEDPVAWRELFSRNRDEREGFFFKTLEDMMGIKDDRRERILRMLQLSCLPFYSGFLPLTSSVKREVSKAKPSRVSVLD